jgi:hypothetical protein
MKRRACPDMQATPAQDPRLQAPARPILVHKITPTGNVLTQ